MREFSPDDYGPVISAMVRCDRNRSLDAGRPDAAALDALTQATVASAFRHARVADRAMAECALAGLWLLYDFLDESHRISQAIETPSGSYWHGVVHRREGDYSNARYWFRRTGRHPILTELGVAAGGLAQGSIEAGVADRLAPGGQFNPSAMVDACQTAVSAGGAAAAFCRRVQQAEWELLFHYCYRSAVGA
jgi:hypothetical protein